MSENKQEELVSTEANSSATKKNIVSEQKLIYAPDEKLAEKMWKQYKKIEPRLRNVLRMLADS